MPHNISRLFKSIHFFFKATPHKARQKTLHVINLQIFCHITHNFLTIRQYAFKNSMQSDEKYICVSAAQALCGIALTYHILINYFNPHLIEHFCYFVLIQFAVFKCLLISRPENNSFRQSLVFVLF